MIDTTRQCPACGGKLAAYGSRHVGNLVKRYRRCAKRCGYREVLTVRPAEVLRRKQL